LPDGSGLLRAYDTRSFDPVAHTQGSIMEIEQVDGDGRFDIYGDFARAPLTASSDTLLAVAWR
jgi:hypothetical protein